MAEVYGWVVTTDAGDEIELSVRDFDEDGSLVSLEARTSYGGNILLTSKEARELARDINAAAKTAAGKK